jgi:hypothetical protein
METWELAIDLLIYVCATRLHARRSFCDLAVCEAFILSASRSTRSIAASPVAVYSG